jgi:CheY-like chemotaxis protein
MRSTGGVLTIGLEVVHSGVLPAGLSPEGWEGEDVCLRVSDTGHGMTEETMKRMFDPYFTTKVVGDGSGLDLAVVHGIVQSHKGFILAESSLGKGTLFRIYLPCCEMVEMVPSGKIPVPPPHGVGHILFVDDEAGIVDLEEMTLKKLGYQVTAKKDSLEALAAFKAAPDSFDVVITDQTMPRMTGLALTQEIKKIRPEIPVILCTGFSEEATPEKALQAGVSMHLFKPISKSDLAHAVQKALGVLSPDSGQS